MNYGHPTTSELLAKEKAYQESIAQQMGVPRPGIASSGAVAGRSFQTGTEAAFGEIPNVLGEIRSMLAELEGNMSSLATRLNPVISAEKSAKIYESPAPPRITGYTSLGSDLAEVHERLRVLSVGVYGLLVSVEL